MVKICKLKKEEVKSPAGSGWASQSPCDKLLHLLKPKFFIWIKRRPEQWTKVAAPSLGAFPSNSQHLFAEGLPPGFHNLLCWVHGESEVPENLVITHPKGSPYPKTEMWEMKILQFSHPCWSNSELLPHGLGYPSGITFRGALHHIRPFTSFHSQCHLPLFLLLHWCGPI